MKTQCSLFGKSHLAARYSGPANHSVSMKITSDPLGGPPALAIASRFRTCVTSVTVTLLASLEYHSHPICETEPIPGPQWYAASNTHSAGDVTGLPASLDCVRIDVGVERDSLYSISCPPMPRRWSL